MLPNNPSYRPSQDTKFILILLCMKLGSKKQYIVHTYNIHLLLTYTYTTHQIFEKTAAAPLFALYLPPFSSSLCQKPTLKALPKFTPLHRRPPHHQLMHCTDYAIGMYILKSVVLYRMTNLNELLDPKHLLPRIEQYRKYYVSEEKD